MARPTPTAEQWRANRNDLVKRITDQQKKFGMLPDQRAAEEFIEPILRRAEVEVAEAQPPAPSEPEPLSRNEVRWNLATDTFEGELAATVRSLVKQRGQKKPPQFHALREWMQNLRLVPEWKEAIEKIMFTYGTVDSGTKHMRLNREGEQKLRELIAKSIRLYGHLTPEAKALAERIEIL